MSRHTMRSCCIGCILSLGFMLPALAEELVVPPFLNYQGYLMDGGGNPLPSGPVTLQFRITDADHHLFFAEEQTVDLLDGLAMALIGNGVDPDTGAVHGGLPTDLFLPASPRFLEVWRDGEAADDPLEIVSVPYARWSDTALRVTPGGVTSESLAQGSIAMGHFREGLLDELAVSLVANPTFQSSLAEVSDAATVGVGGTFAYSGGQSVEAVLHDLDIAIKAREEKNLNKTGDTVLGTLTMEGGTITGLPDPVASGDASNRSFVETTIETARTQLTADIGDVQADLANESAERTAADSTLQAGINAEATVRAAADSSLQTSLQGEATTRAAADGSLQADLTAESDARAAADQTQSEKIVLLEAGAALQSASVTTITQEYLKASQLKIASGVVESPPYSDEEADIQYTSVKTPGSIDSNKCHWMASIANFITLIPAAGQTDPSLVPFTASNVIDSTHIGFTCVKRSRWAPTYDLEQIAGCKVQYLIICVD